MTSSTGDPARSARDAPATGEEDRGTGEKSHTAPATGTAGLTHKQILTILAGLMTGMFLAALDQTIVSTAVRTIADDLHGLSMQAWITTAYLITATIATPIYGKLSDIYGRKPFYLAAISIFLVGSIASTFAQSMYQLAAFRAIQGLGGGGLMSLALTILGDIVPPRQRARYQGFFLAVFGTSTVVGPVIGGFFAGLESFAGVDGWRWVFLVNVPLGLIALFVVGKVLNVPHERQDHRIDWWGGLALAVGVIPLLLVAEQGRDWGWDSTGALACYAIGGAGLIVFVLVERMMGDAALIPLRLFRNATFSVAIAGGFIVGIAMFGVITLVPQYLQIVQGYSPTESGLQMLPFMLGVMSGSVISGQLTSRTGRYKIFPVIGTALMTGGMLLFAQTAWDTPAWQLMLSMVVVGLGLGNCMQTLIIAVQNAGPPRDMGVSTASATFFRQIGGTAGVAVFLSILFSTLMDNIRSAFVDAGVSPAALERGGDIMQDSSFVQELPLRVARPIFIGFTESFTTVMYVGAGVAAMAFLVLLFMREIPLTGGAPAGAPTQTDEPHDSEPTDNESQDSKLQVGAAREAGQDTSDARDGVVAVSATDSVTDPVTDPAAGLVPELDPVPDGEVAPAQAGQPNGQWSEPGAAAPVGMTSGNGRHAVAGRYGTGPAGSPHPGATVTGNGSTGAPAPAGSVVHTRVRRSDGAALPQAALTLIDPRGRQVGRGHTGADGTYELRAPGAGTYVLIASASAHQPEASTVTVGTGPVDMELVLTGTSGLAGRITESVTGNVVAEATVTLTDSRGEVVASRVTGDSGEYAFGDLVAGSYTLVVSAARSRPAAVAVAVSGSGETRQDVELAGGAQLRGVATVGPEGRTVTDARITLLDAGGNVMGVTLTGPGGEYHFTDLPDGDYTVIASGYPPVASTLRIEPGERGEHDVRLGYPEDDHATRSGS